MSLRDIINTKVIERKRLDSKKIESKVVVPKSVVVEHSLFIPASDKLLAIDKSRGLKVEFRTQTKTSREIRYKAIFLFRKFTKRFPNLQYLGVHSANIFAKKSCFIFYDTKRKVKVALTRQEIENKLSLNKY